MSDKPPAPFGQSTAGVLLIQGLLGPAIGAIIGVLLTLGLTRSNQIPWTTVAVIAVIVAVAVFLLLSLFLRRLRSLVWGSARRLVRWLAGVRLTTRAARAELDQTGYLRREAELLVQRAKQFDPTWKVSARDRFREKNLFWLENSGFEVQDVRLTCDSGFFVLEAEAFWEGGFGTDQAGGLVGKWFRGLPTERGRKEGVAFKVEWRDRHGDLHSRDVMMPPEEIRAGDNEAIQEAWAEGRAEGRREVIEDGIPVPPPPGPRWKLTLLGKGSGRHKVIQIENLMEGSKVTNARMEAPREAFTFDDQAFWPDLSGKSTATFEGSATATGAYDGFRIYLHWLDHEMKPQHDDWWISATEDRDAWDATPF